MINSITKDIKRNVRLRGSHNFNLTLTEKTAGYRKRIIIKIKKHKSVHSWFNINRRSNWDPVIFSFSFCFNYFTVRFFLYHMLNFLSVLLKQFPPSLPLCENVIPFNSGLISTKKGNWNPILVSAHNINYGNILTARYSLWHSR